MSIHYNCERIGRRDCLKLGLSAATGLGFADLLRLRGLAADSSKLAPASIAKPKIMSAQPTSCILIWLDGGPTHYETFDPKPNAPKEIRGEFNPIQTSVPGIHYSQELPKLASIADKLAIVRSICHNQGNHGAGKWNAQSPVWLRLQTNWRLCVPFATIRGTMGPAIII